MAKDKKPKTDEKAKGHDEVKPLHKGQHEDKAGHGTSQEKEHELNPAEVVHEDMASKIDEHGVAHPVKKGEA